MRKEFQHIWMYYRIRLEEYAEVKESSDWHDSLWAERIDIKQLGIEYLANCDGNDKKIYLALSNCLMN